MSHKSVSRRNFLKIGCLATAAASMAVCGVGAAIPIDESEVDLPSTFFGGKNMSNRILVVYASGLGSTAEIAVEIGKTLETQGIPVDVRPVRENPQIADYQAVLLGSAVRHGNWLPEAVEFVKTNQHALNDVPVALFTVHITNLGNDPASTQARHSFVDQVRSLLHAVDEVYFAGKFDRRGAALMLPDLLARLIPTMDFRNFKTVRSWTENLYPLLAKQVD
ncbi:MAG: flavodoxin domain-containing protein [Anaerolineales bacterium]|nr:flavodoxin domain-containing protein [Anaerolineales bacterium]